MICVHPLFQRNAGSADRTARQSRRVFNGVSFRSGLRIRIAASDSDTVDPSNKRLPAVPAAASEESRLIFRRRLAAFSPQRTSYNSKHLNAFQGLAGHEYALIVRVRLGRGDRKTCDLPSEQVVRQNAIEDFSIAELHSHPEAVQLRAGEENPARFRLNLEVLYKANTFYFFVRK